MNLEPYVEAAATARATYEEMRRRAMAEQQQVFENDLAKERQRIEAERGKAAIEADQMQLKAAAQQIAQRERLEKRKADIEKKFGISIDELEMSEKQEAVKAEQLRQEQIRASMGLAQAGAQRDIRRDDLNAENVRAEMEERRLSKELALSAEQRAEEEFNTLKAAEQRIKEGVAEIRAPKPQTGPLRRPGEGRIAMKVAALKLPYDIDVTDLDDQQDKVEREALDLEKVSDVYLKEGDTRTALDIKKRAKDLRDQAEDLAKGEIATRIRIREEQQGRESGEAYAQALEESKDLPPGLVRYAAAVFRRKGVEGAMAQFPAPVLNAIFRFNQNRAIDPPTKEMWEEAYTYVQDVDRELAGKKLPPLTPTQATDLRVKTAWEINVRMRDVDVEAETGAEPGGPPMDATGEEPSATGAGPVGPAAEIKPERPPEEIRAELQQKQSNRRENVKKWQAKIGASYERAVELTREEIDNLKSELAESHRRKSLAKEEAKPTLISRAVEIDEGDFAKMVQSIENSEDSEMLLRGLGELMRNREAIEAAIGAAGNETRTPSQAIQQLRISLTKRIPIARKIEALRGRASRKKTKEYRRRVYGRP